MENGFAVQRNAGEKLLQTYNEERLENAKHLLQTTDRMFQFAAGSEWFLSFLRTDVLPPLAKYILSFDPVRRFLFPLNSQIGISYRHSSLSQHTGDEDFKIKAGDRMPYFLIDGESIYDKLRQPKFHWLVFSNGGLGGLCRFGGWAAEYARLCRCAYLQIRQYEQSQIKATVEQLQGRVL